MILAFFSSEIPKMAGTVTTGADQIYLQFLDRFLHRTSQGGEFFFFFFFLIGITTFILVSLHPIYLRFLFLFLFAF